MILLLVISESLPYCCNISLSRARGAPPCLFLVILALLAWRDVFWLSQAFGTVKGCMISYIYDIKDKITFL